MGDWLRLYYRLLSHQPEFSLKRKFKMRHAAEKAKNSVCLITLFLALSTDTLYIQGTL